MTERVGQQLGNYQLTRLLGRGGFAEVYLGEHLYLKTPAAIKILQAHLSSPEDRDSFHREAQTVARLIHPNIIRVIDFGVTEETPYLVMDYAPNGNVRQRHPKGTRLPLATIVSYVKQLAAGLQYAHDEKLVHRDIKPENMLLGRRDEILLSDFGIALVAQSSRHQGTEDVVGTVAYMSPEQIQGKPRTASDQYSLAIVVYEWLCGDLPFHGSFTELCTQQMYASPPPLRDKLPALAPEIEHVLMIALSKDPKQRFGNVQAFANALEQAYQSTQAGAGAQPTPLILPAPHPAPPEASGAQPALPPQASGAHPALPTRLASPPPGSSGSMHGLSQSSTSGPVHVTPPTQYSGPIHVTPPIRTTGSRQQPPAPVPAQLHSGASYSPPLYPYPPQPYYPPYQHSLRRREDGLWRFGLPQLFAVLFGTACFNLSDHFRFVANYNAFGTSFHTLSLFLVVFLFFSSAFGPLVGLLTGLLGSISTFFIQYPTLVLLWNGTTRTIPARVAEYSNLSTGQLLIYTIAGFLIGLVGFRLFYKVAALPAFGAAVLADLVGTIFLTVFVFFDFLLTLSTYSSNGINVSSFVIQPLIDQYVSNILLATVALLILLPIASLFMRSPRVKNNPPFSPSFPPVP